MGIRESYLQRGEVKLGLQNIFHWDPRVDFSESLQSPDAFICSQFHLHVTHVKKKHMLDIITPTQTRHNEVKC